jgi:hypothetical protein
MITGDGRLEIISAARSARAIEFYFRRIFQHWTKNITNVGVPKSPLGGSGVVE